MAGRKSAIPAMIVTLLTLIIGFGTVYLFLNNPIAFLERGPRAVVFTLALALLCFVTGFISLYFWIRKGRSKKAAKNYLLVMLILFIIGGGYGTWTTIQSHKEYSYITVDGIERQYLIYVPTSYTPGTDVPLLLALHGGSGNAKQFRDQTHFDSLAEAEGFIAVYPDGLGALPYSMHVWNSGYIGAALAQGTDDVTFLTELIADLKVKYSINASRVYMTGHSNGGMMTDRMAAEHPELFAAAAPVSSAVGGKATQDSPMYTIPTPTSSVSIVRVHGKQDLNVLYEGGYSQSGFNVGERYDVSVNASVTFWRDHNGCDLAPISSNSTDDLITIDRYLNGADNTEVALVTIHYENHFWENMNDAVRAEAFYGDSMSEMIWNLLKTHVKL